MHYNHLSWTIQPDVNSNSVCYASVTPVIDGVAIETPWIFDTLRILALRRNGLHELDMFTCSCGVAGCIGIHDSTYIDVDKNLVQWRFPRKAPFLGSFNSKYFVDATLPFVWTFQRTAYLDSLDALQDQLQLLEDQYKHVSLRLTSDPEEDVPESIIQAIATEKNHLRRWSRDLQTYKKRWKSLDGAYVEIMLGEERAEVMVASIFQGAAERALGYDAPCSDIDAFIDEQIDRFESSHQSILDSIKTLPWSDVLEYGHITSYTSTPAPTLATAWPFVDTRCVAPAATSIPDWETF